MKLRSLVAILLTATTTLAFAPVSAYAQEVSTKTTFSGDNIRFFSPAGEAVIAFTDVNKNGEIKYLPLDSLKRPQAAYGYITKEMREQAKARGRQNISVDPVGYAGNNKRVGVRFQERGYEGWFYNRSHMIADSLGGDAIRENLVTGTRMQNVGWNKGGEGGMAYIEEKARNFLDSAKAQNCPLYYAATPNYVGSEILPRTVTVNAKSCDNTINEQIVVDNNAPGYTINYVTGSFREGHQPHDEPSGENSEKTMVPGKSNKPTPGATEDSETPGSPNQNTGTPQVEQNNDAQKKEIESATSESKGVEMTVTTGITTSPTPTTKSGDVGAKIISTTDKSTTVPHEQKSNPPNKSHFFSTVITPLSLNQGQHPKYGPKVETGGNIHISIWTKIANLFR